MAGVHDHRCSDACAASEEHIHAMDLDAWRQIAELEAADDEQDES